MNKNNFLITTGLFLLLSLIGVKFAIVPAEAANDTTNIFAATEVCKTQNTMATTDPIVLNVNEITLVADEVCKTPTDLFLITVTEEEIDLMARVVMSEASVLCYDAKVATAQTIVNRVRSNYREFKYQNTVLDVVNRPYQFSTQNNGEVTQECYDAVYDALTYETFPTDMLWFCKSSKSYGVVYAVFGSGKYKTYFSTVLDYEEIVRRESNGRGGED